MLDLDPGIGILAIVVVAFLAGLGWSIGAWLWARICARFGW